MNSIGKIFMFLSSYSPLYIFIITLNYDFSDIKASFFRITIPQEIVKSDVILYVLLGLILISNMIVYIFIIFSKKDSESVKIVGIENGNDKVLDYILAYIVSFMTTDFAAITTNDSKSIITAILIQTLLGYLYCKSNMLYINPVLNFIGYDIYLVGTPNNNVVLLSKDKEIFKKIRNDINKNGFKNMELDYFSKGIYII